MTTSSTSHIPEIDTVERTPQTSANRPDAFTSHDTALLDRSMLEDNDTGSDYGDFGQDEETLHIIDRLRSQAEAQASAASTSLLVTDIEDYEGPRGVRLPKIIGAVQKTGRMQPQTRHWSQSQIPYNSDAASAGIQRNKDGYEKKAGGQPSVPIEEKSGTIKPDNRSPLERFRRPPKKALSVTDLVSPSWCELQYFYTLAKHGRKKRTPAMKQGTAVHQALEDEVHTTVPVEISKVEDSWGLRIWNIIQGLRTLRDTGRTRELEIWGSIGGEIVNGVIDELSYTCPDPKLEATSTGKTTTVEDVLPEYQRSITDYLVSSSGHADDSQNLSDALKQSNSQQRQKRNEGKEEKRIYITDMKTRASATLPTGASVRPTILQLHLYHHMLENLAQGNFSLIQLADRYGFDIHEVFSDSFIAQVGSLNEDLVETHDAGLSAVAGSQIASSQGSMDILLQHNTLSSLWEFMISQFRLTFLLPSSSANPIDETPTSTLQSTSDILPPPPLPTRLSPILTAEYIAPTYAHAKKTIGSKSYLFNAAFLRNYLTENLSWWRGEREAKGVELQEAWKCRSCDFKEDCIWIHERDAAALAEVMERKKLREQVAGIKEAVDTGDTEKGSASKSKV